MENSTSPKSATTRPLVVVVGAGPVGLALAIELGTRDIPCVVLERSERSGNAPRAKATHVRTRELMRRWGIADDLAKLAPFGVDYPSHIHFVTRLGGHSLVRFDHTLNCRPVRDPRYSEHGQWIPQYKVEQVLVAKARTLPSVELRYGCEFVGYEQSEDGVIVRYKSLDTGEEGVFNASYLVGADGGRSCVRAEMGIEMEGAFGLSWNHNIIFHAPGLAEAHGQGPGIMYWQLNPDSPSVIAPMDGDDIWTFGPSSKVGGSPLTDEEAIDLIKRSTGIDLPYKILSSDVWVANRVLAQRYRDKRVFLAGDACHLHPPFGGFGMNMGVADAVDLGWKLAAVLQGWGGATLLDSYEQERRPIHHLVLEEAEGNHSVRANELFREGIEDPTPEGEAIRAEVAQLIRQTKYREFNALGVVLGLRYCASPVIVRDGTEAEWRMARENAPSAAPGSLAPHAWLDDECSLYDLFGNGYTLLVLGDANAMDVDAARRDAEKASIPLKVVELNRPDLLALYEAPLALIRPDQVVAWRGSNWPVDVLEYVAGRGTGSARAVEHHDQPPAHVE